MIGKSVGKYRIVDQLGRGGMGTVYRAVDETLGRDVAVRVINPALQESDVIKRFRADAATLAALNHPGIATCYEVYQADQYLLMVMELVRGETFEQVSQRSGQLPAERAAYLVAQVLGALERAHEAGIIHRDLKPANLMVTDAGGIKILDFGVAAIADADRLTTDGELLGSPAYMSPEQAMSKRLDGRSDLYSCGVVFYRLLTGQLPFKADKAVDLMQKQLSAAPTPASTYRRDLPSWCGAILDRALAKAPADRYQTADEFRAALMVAIDTTAGVPTAEFTAAHPSAMKPVAVPRPVIAQAAPPIVVPPPIVAPTIVAAKPAVVTPPPAAPAARKGNPVLAIGAVVAVLVVAALAVFALRRPTEAPSPVAAAPPVAATTPPAATPPTAQPEAAPISPPTATTAAEVPPPKSRRATATKKPTPLPAVTPSPETAVVPVAPAPAPVVVDAPPAKVVPALPPFVVSADAVVGDGDKYREQDATVQIADGKVTVTRSNGRAIAAFPFDTILGITYSTSRHPQWNAPSGPTDVFKVEGGAFGIRRAGRNWLVFQTTDPVVVIRVKDEDIRRVIEAIQARTGRAVVRIPEQKD
jgi:hypothetical protein